MVSSNNELQSLPQSHVQHTNIAHILPFLPGEIAFLPTLVLAARLCPPGVEAVLFATLMSIYNGASTVGTEIGAALTKVLGVTETDFSNLALLTIICNVSSLLPLVFIGMLDGVGDESQEEMEAKQIDGND